MPKSPVFRVKTIKGNDVVDKRGSGEAGHRDSEGSSVGQLNEKVSQGRKSQLPVGLLRGPWLLRVVRRGVQVGIHQRQPFWMSRIAIGRAKSDED